MNEIDRAINAVGLPVFLAVFVVVFVLSLLFASKLGREGPLRVVFAFCVAALCATGLMVLGSSGVNRGVSQSGANANYHFLLLPYAALGLVLLMLFLLVFVFRWVAGFKERHGANPENAWP